MGDIRFAQPSCRTFQANDGIKGEYISCAKVYKCMIEVQTHNFIYFLVNVHTTTTTKKIRRKIYSLQYRCKVGYMKKEKPFEKYSTMVSELRYNITIKIYFHTILIWRSMFVQLIIEQITR